MSLHQDRDERNLDQPIVSVSLGVDAAFLWGGHARSDRARKVALHHGDVVVWGGPARLAFHGIDTLATSAHPLTVRLFGKSSNQLFEELEQWNRTLAAASIAPSVP